MSEAREVPLLVVRHGRAEGVVRWSHAGRERFEPRAAGVRCAALRGRDGAPLAQAHVRGSVGPGESADLLVKLRVHEHSAPGVYKAELLLGDKPTPVQIAVPEVRRVRLSPATLTLERGTARQQHLVIVENAGNAPVHVDHPEAAKLEPTNRSCTVLRDALAAATSDEPRAILDALVGAAAASAESDPVVAARLTDGPIDLPPGARAVLRLKFRVPEKLDQPRYTGELLVGGKALRLNVLR